MKQSELIKLIKEEIQRQLSEIQDEPKTFADWKINYIKTNPEQTNKSDEQLKQLYDKYKDNVKKDVINETEVAQDAIQSWLDKHLEAIKAEEPTTDQPIKEITDAEREAIYARRLKGSDKPPTDLQRAISQGSQEKTKTGRFGSRTRSYSDSTAIKAIPQQTKTYKNLPMSDSEYQRLLQTTAKTTPKDSTFDVAHNMMYDPRVKAYVTKTARLDGVLPIERIQWDLENYVK